MPFKYCRGIISPCAHQQALPGPARLLATLPVLLCNLAVPLLLNRATDATTITLVAFNTTWLSRYFRGNVALHLQISDNCIEECFLFSFSNFKITTNYELFPAIMQF